MRLTPIAAVLLVLAPAAAGAQDRTARNGIYGELGGNGVWWSLNYERFVAADVSLRAGAGYVSVTTRLGSRVSLATFPLTASWLALRSGSHALEIGAGVVFASATVDTTAFGADVLAGRSTLGTAIAGYRLAPPEGGFNLRVAVTPLFGGGQFHLWAGLAAGSLF